MRPSAWLALVALSAGCRGPAAPERGVRVQILYQGFHPGCVRLTATDAADGSHVDSVDVSPAGTQQDGELNVAVLRHDGWSDALAVEVTAFEHACGAQVVRQLAQPATIPESGVELLTFTLQATDADGDGFVAAPDGTDCDDAVATTFPGAPERCNGRDDDCDGVVDDGLDVGLACPGAGGCVGAWVCLPDGTRRCDSTSARWRPDRDRDLRGDSASPGIASCLPPGADYAPRVSGQVASTIT